MSYSTEELKRRKQSREALQKISGIVLTVLPSKNDLAELVKSGKLTKTFLKKARRAIRQVNGGI